MNELITISNVSGYFGKNGTAYLNLDDVARGLGFTQMKNGYSYVRWETVQGYLAEFGYSQRVGKDEYIPENIFYRLAMKAKNETAERFQAKVADEILPQIRKTGSYSVKVPKTFAEALRLAADLEEEKQKLLPKAQGYDYLMNAEGTVTIGEAASIIDIKGIGQNKFFKLLVTEEIIFKKGNSYLPYSDFKEHFIVKQNPVRIGELVENRSQLYLTMQDLDWLAKLLSRRGYVVNYKLATREVHYGLQETH